MMGVMMEYELRPAKDKGGPGPCLYVLDVLREG